MKLLPVALFFYCAVQGTQPSGPGSHSIEKRSPLFGFHMFRRPQSAAARRASLKKTRGQSFWTTTDLIRESGYPAEEHTVVTEDGYILSIHRIPYGNKSPAAPGKKPVLIQHGFLSASDIWVLQGPEKSLGFLLADAGYDVWLANIRGNVYNRKHVSLSPSSAKFWDFSFHEIAMYDVPAMIDYVLKVTGQPKLFYTGHSMGATVFFAMVDVKPEYNDKIRLMIGLAPVAFGGQLGNSFLASILPYHVQISKALDQMGVREVLPRTTRLIDFIEKSCTVKTPLHELCAYIYNMAYGFDDNQLNRTLLPQFFIHSIGGASKKTLAHFAQNYFSGNFNQFDWGKAQNMKKYGQPQPPDYNLRKVTVPVTIYYGLNDFLLHKLGVDKLIAALPNLDSAYQVPNENYNHIDFVLALNVKTMVYDRVMEVMKKY